MPRLTNLPRNLAAFLDMIAWSEIGPELLRVTEDGYNVLVGSTTFNPLTFWDYDTHPKRYNPACHSDAAGRYQFLGRYWSFYKSRLKLPDFGPESQDRWALALIDECKARPAILSGDLPQAIHLCRSRWASLPGAGYGQRENALADLEAVFRKAGGTLTSPKAKAALA